MRTSCLASTLCAASIATHALGDSASSTFTVPSTSLPAPTIDPAGSSLATTIAWQDDHDSPTLHASCSQQIGGMNLTEQIAAAESMIALREMCDNTSQPLSVKCLWEIIQTEDRAEGDKLKLAADDACRGGGGSVSSRMFAGGVLLPVAAAIFLAA